MEIFKSGDIVYANLPSPKDQQTHVQSGPRPVVIVQDEDDYASLPTIVIIPFTKQVGGSSFSTCFSC
jgi:mRNA-degrading endonuclease toxin of MazEF toxin-antitoxin module